MENSETYEIKIVESEDKRFAILLNTLFGCLEKRSLIMIDSKTKKEYFRVPNGHDDRNSGQFSFYYRAEQALNAVKNGFADYSFDRCPVDNGKNTMIYYLDRDYGRKKADEFIEMHKNTFFRYFISLNGDYYGEDGKLCDKNSLRSDDGFSSKFLLLEKLQKIKDLTPFEDFAHTELEDAYLRGLVDMELDHTPHLDYLEAPFYTLTK